MRNIFTLAAISLCPFLSFSQDGTLDPSFGTGGKAYANAPQLNSSLSKIVVQPDGKVLVAGRAVAGCCAYDFSVVRFNADGTPDNTFDGDGLVITELTTNASDVITTLALQPDGKIIAGGYSNGNFALVRYNSDGSLDVTFDGDGKLTTDISGSDEIYSIALQSDGKIVVAGTSGSLDRNFTIARYLTNGALDATFGTGGIVSINVGASNAIDIAYSVIVQSNGKITVSGQSDNDMAFVRLLANGTLDTSFDSDGKQTVDLGGADIAYSIAYQANGSLVAAGVSGFDMGMVRLTSAGALDPTFDGDGKLVTTVSGNFNQLYSVLIQADGKILAGGLSYNGTNEDFAIIRLLNDGSFDPTFDTDGKLSIDMGGGDTYATIAAWGDRLLIGGYSSGQLAVARLFNSSFILPLKLGNFDGRVESNKAILTWLTLQEANTSHFEIEESKDGIAFTKLGRVAAAGNSTTPAQYSYSSIMNSARSFYRLKMVDLDGRSTYSPIVTLTMQNAAITVVENPVRSVLDIRFSNTGVATVQVVNNEGRVIATAKKLPGAASLSINASTWAAGVYHLVLTNNGQTQSVPFLKN